MPLDDLIGSCLAVSLPGSEVTQNILDHLKTIHARNLVAFRRNIRSPEHLRRLILDLERALGWRLLVMVDHEGGRVIRFDAGITRFPDAASIARRCTARMVNHQGQVEARELRRLGVFVNLAPCVDVVAEGSDPIIGDRSYGSDPVRVSELAAARIHGLQSRGVAACAKHFPGLGAVPKDPHAMLSSVRLNRSTLERIHLAPFRAAIRARVAMVMSSHVHYPAFGDPPGRPATFSRTIIQRLLRERMRFAGLILSDDLEMGAIGSHWSVGQAVIRAAEAGHDLLLLCSGRLDAQKEAFSSLRRAYELGRLDRGRLRASARRLERVREKFLGNP